MKKEQIKFKCLFDANYFLEKPTSEKVIPCTREVARNMTWDYKGTANLWDDNENSCVWLKWNKKNQVFRKYHEVNGNGYLIKYTWR